MPDEAVVQVNEPPAQGDNQDPGTTQSLFGEDGSQVAEGEYPDFQPAEPPQEITEGDEGTTPEPGANTPPAYYTPEEMRNLSEEQIDTSRIPPEMLPFYKAIQGNYTRKHQALAEAARQVQIQQQPQREPANLDEAFMRDPQGVLGEIETAIVDLTRQAKAKADTDPFGAVKLQNKVLELNQIKDNFKGKIVQAQQQYQQVEALRGQYLNDVASIPDFESKHLALTDFAVNELGYSEQELAMLCDPVRTGSLAGKFVKSLNAMYDKVHGNERSAAGKEIKTTPPPLLRPMGGAPPQSSAPNMSRLFKQAKETGDWKAYLKAKGY